MKDKAQELKDLLFEMGTFLKRYNEDDDWGDALLNMIDYVDVDLKEAKRIIRTWYGGMGSFNDIGVYDIKNGDLLREENRKFSELRHKLYELSRNWVSN